MEKTSLPWPYDSSNEGIAGSVSPILFAPYRDKQLIAIYAPIDVMQNQAEFIAKVFPCEGLIKEHIVTIRLFEWRDQICFAIIRVTEHREYPSGRGGQCVIFGGIGNADVLFRADVINTYFILLGHVLKRFIGHPFDEVACCEAIVAGLCSENNAEEMNDRLFKTMETIVCVLGLMLPYHKAGAIQFTVKEDVARTYFFDESESACNVLIRIMERLPQKEESGHRGKKMRLM